MTDFETNVASVKKSFLFTKRLRGKVLAKKKTQTRRQLPHKLEVGDLAYVKTKRMMKKVDSPAIIKITGLRIERMRDISDADLKKECVNYKEYFIDLIYRLYPDAVKKAEANGEQYNPEMVVVDFKLVQTNPNHEEMK